MADDAVINVVSPLGEQTAIKLTDLEEAQRQGYQIASGENVVQQQRAEKYDAPITAGLEGIARGATFGLSDIGATDAQQARREFNPVAAGVGEVAGTVGTLGVSGIGDAAGAAGRAAFSGSGILSRAGAAAVRTGIEGGAVGVGQGISDVAMSQDPMTAEAIVGTIGHHALMGTVTGAVTGGGLSLAGSGLGAAIGAAGKVVRKAAEKFQGEVADGTDALATAEPALREEVLAMSKPDLVAAQKAEQSTVEAVRAEQGTALAKDLETFRYDVRGELTKLKGSLPRGQGLVGEVIGPEKALHKVVGDLKTLAEDPSMALGPLRRIEQQMTKLGDKLPDGTFQPTLDRLSDLQNRIANLTGDATSPRLDALSARLEQLAAPAPKTPIIDAAVKGAGAAVGGAVGHLSGIPGAGFAGAWLGKELSETIAPLARKILGSFVDHATAIADGADGMLSKLTPPQSALDVLKDFAAATAVKGETAYESASKALTQAAANPQQAAGQIKQQLAGLHAAAPLLAEQVAEGMLRKVNFLASKITPQVSMGISGQLIPPTDDEQATFARYVAAASDPMRLMKELRAGQLMPETVETHEALYPQIKARIQSALTTQLADPVIASKLPYEMRLQLSMLLGPSVDATLDPSFVALMQQTFTQPQGQKVNAGTTTQKTPPDVTAAQRLTTR